MCKRDRSLNKGGRTWNVDLRSRYGEIGHGYQFSKLPPDSIRLFFLHCRFSSLTLHISCENPPSFFLFRGLNLALNISI